jgi:hypothetical protein
VPVTQVVSPHHGPTMRGFGGRPLRPAHRTLPHTAPKGRSGSHARMRNVCARNLQGSFSSLFMWIVGSPLKKAAPPDRSVRQDFIPACLNRSDMTRPARLWSYGMPVGLMARTGGCCNAAKDAARR